MAYDYTIGVDDDKAFSHIVVQGGAAPGRQAGPSNPAVLIAL